MFCSQLDCTCLLYLLLTPNFIIFKVPSRPSYKVPSRSSYKVPSQSSYKVHSRPSCKVPSWSYWISHLRFRLPQIYLQFHNKKRCLNSGKLQKSSRISKMYIFVVHFKHDYFCFARLCTATVVIFMLSMQKFIMLS